jgi:hypothetical protein
MGNFVQLSNRRDMIGTEAMPPTHQCVVHVPTMKMCGLPSWLYPIAIEWQLSHPKGTITGPK